MATDAMTSDGTSCSHPASVGCQETAGAARVRETATGGASASAELDPEAVKEADEYLNEAVCLRYKKDFGALLISAKV